MERWESEGGRIPATRDARGGDEAVGPVWLPADHQAQPTWGFHDSAQRGFLFHHVYGPLDSLDHRGPLRHLVEDLCYWEMTEPAWRPEGHDRPGGRWLTWAEARRLRGSRLKFGRFASGAWMQAQAQNLFGRAHSPAHTQTLSAGARAATYSGAVAQ